MRRLFAVFLITACYSFLSGLTSTAQASPLKHIIVSLQPTDSGQAGKEQVDLAADAGFNAIRVIMPWSFPGQADAVNDAPRICTLAAEASVRHMALYLNVVPTNASPPVQASQITKYNKTVADYLHYLVGSKGCAPELSEVDVQAPNEANYSVFFKSQDTAAQDYTHILVRMYRFLRSEVVRQGFLVPVQIVGGELNSSHDPVGFMGKMRDEAQKMHYHGPFFDKFSYHCYGTGGLAVTPPDAVRAALLSDFGQDVPLLCSEFADASASQDKLYCQAIAMSLNKGLDGFGWFRLFDDPTGATTGFYYYDPAMGQAGDHPVAKSSLYRIRGYNASALSGSVNCG